MGRVVIDPNVCGGQPCIRGTRIHIAIILDSLAEGFTPEQIIEEYPQLTSEDIRRALAYAAELSRENIWKVSGLPSGNHRPHRTRLSASGRRESPPAAERSS
jgi:uncharacterized protein (DUF433 family)